MWRFISLLFVSLVLGACDSPDTPAVDTQIYLNGTIYTGLDENPVAGAVVVSGNRIVLVGSEENARAYAGGGEVIDLGGAFMYPGFTDSHVHLMDVGLRELTLNLEGTSSIEALVFEVERAVSMAGPGQVIFGRGWIETHWPENRFPTAADLDVVSPDNIVILERADGHAIVVNSRALQAAGITTETVAPSGGEILRDENGAPAGLLVDNAASLLVNLLMPTNRSIEDLSNIYQVGAGVYNAYGWTGGHNMSVNPAHILLLEGLSDTDRITLRVYNSLDGENPGTAAIIENGPSRSEDGLVITRAIKLYMDGSLGSRGALLLEPYHDAETKGLLLADKAVYLDLMKKALRNGIQVNTHAIGDRANRLLLDWYGEAFAAVPAQDRAIVEPRWRDEHTQIVDAQDIPRFAELGVIPSMQPSHAIGDLYFAPSRLGPDRLVGAYAWRSLIDSGVIIAGGSDAPVERGDPRIEFYAAVARKSLDGFEGEGWHPEQAVSRTEALKMFTIWPAYASFRENDLGTIEVGKLADFTVFSADIMEIPEEEILGIDVVMTVVDGKVVFQNPDS